MYTIIFSILVSCFFACINDWESSAFPKASGCDFFTKDNAVKILGRDVVWSSEESATDDGGRRWNCTFSAASEKADGPKLYFVLIRNTSEAAAKKAFDDIRKSNNKKAGYEEWPGVGSEAMIHSNEKNFQFVMVRHGAGTIRIKVNPAKGTSLDDLKTVAASLVMKL